MAWVWIKAVILGWAKGHTCETHLGFRNDRRSEWGRRWMGRLQDEFRFSDLDDQLKEKSCTVLEKAGGEEGLGKKDSELCFEQLKHKTPVRMSFRQSECGSLIWEKGWAGSIVWGITSLGGNQNQGRGWECMGELVWEENARKEEAQGQKYLRDKGGWKEASKEIKVKQKWENLERQKRSFFQKPRGKNISRRWECRKKGLKYFFKGGREEERKGGRVGGRG